MKKIVVFCSVFLLIAGIGIAAQSEALRNLQTLMSNTQRNPQFQGFRMIGQPKTWSMRKMEQRSFQYNLNTVGQRVIFMASGDNNSFDIDMYVYDQDGVLVGQDQTTPSYQGGPGTDCGVFLNILRTGTYTVKVDLYSAIEGVNVDMAMAYGTY